MTIDETAKKLGYTYLYTCKVARDEQIKFTRPYVKKNEHTTAKRNREICDRYLKGEEQATIARDVGLTRERVRQIVERAGLVPERQRQKDFALTVVGAVVRKSLTASQAAEMFNILPCNVYKYCRDHGVTPSAKTAEEIAELDALAAEVKGGKSLRNAAGNDHNAAGRLARYMKEKGINAKGRSRHDDFSERKVLLERWRSEGKSWSHCAKLLSEHDGRPIGAGGLAAWAWKRMPHLINKQSSFMEAAE